MILLSPTTAFNPIGAMMLVSVRPCAVSSPPSPPLAERCCALLTASDCGDPSLRMRPSLPHIWAHATDRRSGAFAKRGGRRAQTRNKKWILSWFHTDFSLFFTSMLWSMEVLKYHGIGICFYGVHWLQKVPYFIY